jgi:hypothetical protein
MNGCGEKDRSYPEDTDLLYCQNKLIWLYMNRSGRYKTQDNQRLQFKVDHVAILWLSLVPS